MTEPPGLATATTEASVTPLTECDRCQGLAAAGEWWLRYGVATVWGWIECGDADDAQLWAATYGGDVVPRWYWRSAPVTRANAANAVYTNAAHRIAVLTGRSAEAPEMAANREFRIGVDVIRAQVLGEIENTRIGPDATFRATAAAEALAGVETEWGVRHDIGAGSGNWSYTWCGSEAEAREDVAKWPGRRELVNRRVSAIVTIVDNRVDADEDDHGW